jgi:ABC-type Fe3+ transport system substrate-binding protein
MYRKFVLPSALAAFFLLPGIADGAEGTPGAPAAATQTAAAMPAEWKKLVRAAKREGKVEVILSGQMPRKLRKLMPEFQKKYGIKVNYQTGSGRAHSARILAERRRGIYSIDAWMGGSGTARVVLMPNKVLARIDKLLLDPEVANPARWYKGAHPYSDIQRRYIFTWGAAPANTVSFNTKLVKPGEIRSFADLLDPKWKGKMVALSPGYRGTGATSVPMFLNPKIGETWFRRWANDMDVTIVGDARQGAEWLALGRFAIGVFGLSTQAQQLQDQGFPIKAHLGHGMREGAVLSASAANIMAIDQAPNPNAMQLFVNWALSREAQSMFIKHAKRSDSLRVDVPNDVIPPQYRIDPKEKYYVSFQDPVYAKRYKGVLKTLRKIMKEAGHKSYKRKRKKKSRRKNN